MSGRRAGRRMRPAGVLAVLLLALAGSTLAACEKKNWCGGRQRACERQCTEATEPGSTDRGDCFEQCRLQNPCSNPPPKRRPPRAEGPAAPLP